MPNMHGEGSYERASPPADRRGPWEDPTRRINGSRPPPEPRRIAHLLVISGSNMGEMFKLDARETVIGRGIEAWVRIDDPSISRRHARVRRSRRDHVLEDIGSMNGTYVNGKQVERHVLADGDKILLGSSTILRFGLADPLDESYLRELRDLVLRDGLTGLFGKRYFSERLEAEVAFALRHGSALGLILFDIDRFKDVNDAHGHPCGDHVLVSLAQHLTEMTRDEDILARFGGEEFAVMVRGLDVGGVQAVAERLRRTVADLSLIWEGRRVTITVSVGVAMLPHHRIRDGLALVTAADAALYRAKRAGRNRVVVYGR